MPRFQQSFNAMGPKVCCICFCFSTFKMDPKLLLLRASDVSSDAFKSIPDLHLDKISSSERSVHEDYSGLAPLFKCGALQAAIHLHVHRFHQSISFPQGIEPYVGCKETDFGQRSSSRAFNPLLGVKQVLADIHIVPCHPVQHLQRSMGDRTLPHRDVAA